MDKSRFAINIFIRKYNVFLSFNLNVFNMFLSVLCYKVDRHKLILDLIIRYSNVLRKRGDHGLVSVLYLEGCIV